MKSEPDDIDFKDSTDKFEEMDGNVLYGAEGLAYQAECPAGIELLLLTWGILCLALVCKFQVYLYSIFKSSR